MTQIDLTSLEVLMLEDICASASREMMKVENYEPRTRGMYFDFSGEGRGPRRGDIMASTRSRYWVLQSRAVKRHDAKAIPRFQMRVIRSEKVSDELRSKLFRSAQRRGGTSIFTFEWYSRKKKTFEGYMRREQNNGD